MNPTMNSRISEILARGEVIPAHPLALTAERRLDERRQRALARYYIAAGAGGLAVGVHTTQFAIRDSMWGFLSRFCSWRRRRWIGLILTRSDPLVRIGGICGDTPQAMREARLLSDLGYHVGMLSLAALQKADDETLISIAATLPA